MIQLVRTEIPFSVGTETLNYQKKGFRWELVSYSGYWYQNQYQLKCEYNRVVILYSVSHMKQNRRNDGLSWQSVFTTSPSINLDQI